MSESCWARYAPSPSAPWGLERAWTLRRRAGFAATWRELRRDIADGPDAAVGRMLDGSCRVDGLVPDFAETARVLGAAAGGSGDPKRLQAWWIYRMLFVPDPLGERLTLMWHDHFATSQLKVRDVRAMKRQNDVMRDHARGAFGDLLRAMLRDPALLAWLDAPANRKGKPNENLARELLELFTLGIGNYGEADVKAAARGLTGRSVVQGRYAFHPSDHDDGEKEILGRVGRFEGDSLADLLLEHPATAGRIAWRLCRAFLGEGVADEAAIGGLADRLRGDGLHIGRAVETILRSRLFHSEGNLHARVADPIGFAVGSVRALELFSPPPSTLLLAEWTERMGLELLFPPNVGGWPGGRGWLSGRGVVARANFAAALVEGALQPGAGANPPDLPALAAREGRGARPGWALDFFGELLTGRPIAADASSAILDAAGPDPGRLNRAIALLLARPEAQLS